MKALCRGSRAWLPLAPISPLFLVAQAAAQCGPWLPGPFGVFGSYGTDAPVRALASWKSPLSVWPELYVGGEFQTLAGGNFSRLARWDGTSWRQVGFGFLTGPVRAMMPYGQELIIGGQFSFGPVQSIATWDGSSLQTKGVLEVGPASTAGVHCIHNHGGTLLIGGQFNINGQPANYARWFNGAWQAVPVNGIVYDIESYNGMIHIGGVFFEPNAQGLMRWNGVAWEVPGAGITGGGAVYTMYASPVENLLYIGGAFSTAGGVSTGPIARWDGTTYSSMGGGLPNATSVHSIQPFPGGMLVAGNFDLGGSRNIARWTGQGFAPLGTGVGGLSSTVYAMAAHRNSMVVGGDLTNVGSGSVTGNNLGQWSGASWSALRPGATGPVYALLPTGSGVYAGGHFDFTINSTQSAFNLLATNGTEASIIAPTGTSANGLSGPVRALGYYSVQIGTPARLIVGGQFAFAAGVPVSNIAQYDGGGWSNMGGGMNGPVHAVVQAGTIQSPRLIAAGAFSNAGGVSASGIAQWVGGAWSAMGSGLTGGANGPAGYALAQYGGQTHIAGHFTHAGGTPASNIARWNGSSWSALDGTQYIGTIYALREFEGKLIAAGDFRIDTPQVIGRVAAWDGNSWVYMQQGVPFADFTPTSLAVHEGSLYLGGQFGPMEDAGYAGMVYRWNGSTWQSAIDLLNGGVRALTSSAGALWAGGGFTTVQGSASPSLTRVICTTPTPCYANCDGSTGAPALNVADFGCFLGKFAAGDPYANCDGSTGAPQLNVADFGCFLTKFAAGCR